MTVENDSGDENTKVKDDKNVAEEDNGGENREIVEAEKQRM